MHCPCNAVAALHIQPCLCFSQVLNLSALTHSPRATHVTLATYELQTVRMPADLGVLVMLVAVRLSVHKLYQQQHV